MEKLKTGKVIMRIIISLIGTAFILWGICTFTLGIAGERTMALITDVRRQGGERNESIRGRYTYIVSYTFKLPDGESIDGVSTNIGNAVYVKVKQPYSTVQVRYFNALPWINAFEKDTEPNMGQLILVLSGGLLVFVMSKK